MPWSRPRKAAVRSLQTNPLIFNLGKALPSQTEVSSTAHCKVTSAQGTGRRGRLPPLQGASEEPWQLGGRTTLHQGAS